MCRAGFLCAGGQAPVRTSARSNRTGRSSWSYVHDCRRRGPGASGRTARCAGTARPPCSRSGPRRPARGAAGRRTGPCRRSTGWSRSCAACARRPRARPSSTGGRRTSVTSGCSSVNSSRRAGHREGADDADRGQHAAVVVQAEQQRADRVRAGLVHAVAGDHAVGGALVLDLAHHPLVRLVAQVQRLGDQPVEPGALELARTSAAPSSRSCVAGVTWIGGCASASACSSAARRSSSGSLGEVVVAEREQVEGDEAGRRLPASSVHPARRGVDALLQRLEVEGVARRCRRRRSRRRSRARSGSWPAPPRPPRGSSGSSAARCGCRSRPRRRRGR